MSGITPRASLDSLPKAPATFALPSYMQCIKEDLASPGLAQRTRAAAIKAAKEFDGYHTPPTLQEAQNAIHVHEPLGRYDDEREAAEGLIRGLSRCRTTSGCEPLASPRTLGSPRTIGIQSPSTISGSPATGSMGYMVPYSPAQKQVVGTPTLS